MYTIEEAKEKLKTGFTFVAFGKNFYCSKERGIRPIVQLLKKDTAALEGMVVCDKVIGKAAALLLVYGKIKMLYTPVLSAPAEDILNKYGVAYQCDQVVDRIKNRTGDGLCPMETLAMGIEEPQEAFAVFAEKI